MGRAPFEVRGPLPIGRERPHQTRRGGLAGRGPTMGSRAPVSCESRVHPALPGPAPTPPPSPKCWHLHQSGGAGPEGWEEPGAGTRPGPHVPKASRGRPRCAPTPSSPPSTPGFRRCAVLRSHRDARLRPGRMSSVPRPRAKRTARLKGAAPAVPGQCRSRSCEGPALRRAAPHPRTSLACSASGGSTNTRDRGSAHLASPVPAALTCLEGEARRSESAHGWVPRPEREIDGNQPNDPFWEVFSLPL